MSAQARIMLRTGALMDGIRSSRRSGDGRSAGARGGTSGRGGRRSHAREIVSKLRNQADRPLLLCLRAKGAYPPLRPRFLPGFPPGPVQFRRQDLAHTADARLASRRDHPPLHCRRAGQVHLSGGAVPVYGFRNVCSAQLNRCADASRRQDHAARAQGCDRGRPASHREFGEEADGRDYGRQGRRGHRQEDCKEESGHRRCSEGDVRRQFCFGTRRTTKHPAGSARSSPMYGRIRTWSR